jgi:hypothetical protein
MRVKAASSPAWLWPARPRIPRADHASRGPARHYGGDYPWLTASPRWPRRSRMPSLPRIAHLAFTAWITVSQLYGAVGSASTTVVPARGCSPEGLARRGPRPGGQCEVQGDRGHRHRHGALAGYGGLGSGLAAQPQAQARAAGNGGPLWAPSGSTSRWTWPAPDRSPSSLRSPARRHRFSRLPASPVRSSGSSSRSAN